MTTNTLTPTQRSVLAQPIDRIIQITGDGPYKGHYVAHQLTDGYLETTTDISKAHKLREYDAAGVVSRIRHNAQYCYGGRFEVVKVN